MRTPPPPPRDDLRFSNTTCVLQKKKKTMGFIGVEVEQETSAPPPKKNPGSAPGPGGLSVRRDLDLAITSRSCFRCRNGYTCNSV